MCPQDNASHKPCSVGKAGCLNFPHPGPLQPRQRVWDAQGVDSEQKMLVPEGTMGSGAQKEIRELSRAQGGTLREREKQSKN